MIGKNATAIAKDVNQRGDEHGENFVRGSESTKQSICHDRGFNRLGTKTHSAVTENVRRKNVCARFPCWLKSTPLTNLNGLLRVNTSTAPRA